MKNKKIQVIITILLNAVYLMFYTGIAQAGMPSSANYQLQNYSFGAGGTTNSTSANYGLNGIAGEVEYGQPNSTNYHVGTGLTYMMTANVPGAPSLSIPANNYDRILFVINPGSNPTDVTYALEISTS